VNARTSGGVFEIQTPLQRWPAERARSSFNKAEDVGRNGGNIYERILYLCQPTGPSMTTVHGEVGSLSPWPERTPALLATFLAGVCWSEVTVSLPATVACGAFSFLGARVDIGARGKKYALSQGFGGE
jgi:hypothetical protein